ncbi:MAG: hypothetical protein IT546_08680 [Caulobacteraceae bacterium]|nr:hypothetical protein [Caulobacteraceae bacterium]
MRYRPFGISGVAASAISLLLQARPGADAQRLALAALENGINTFTLVGGSREVAEGAGIAWTQVERHLLVLGLRLPGPAGRPVTAEYLSAVIREHLAWAGLEYFDFLLLEEAAFAALTSEAIRLLGDLRAVGLARLIGVAGSSEALDACIGSELFEVLAAPFDMTSGWAMRRRIKNAVEAEMALICCDASPDALCQPPRAQKAKLNLLGRAPANPLSGAGTYAFLHHTKGWGAEELCIGYVLTEPAFATIQIDTTDVALIERYASITDRDLPTGVAAQIEMARFAVQQPIARSA